MRSKKARKSMLLSALVFMALVSPLFAASSSAPEGWFLAGSSPGDYETGVAEGSAFLKSDDDGSDGFGTLMQTFDAKAFRDQRVRMTADVKSEGVENWAGLWMRVDGKQRGPSLAFDNMQDRAIKGSTPWDRYAIVLDVPEESRAIAFGVLVSGKGQVWVDNFQFEVVGEETPLTGAGAADALSKQPINLTFEE